MFKLFSVAAFALKPGPSVLKAFGVCSAIVLAKDCGLEVIGNF